MAVTRLTELGAVNTMLAGIGEAPFNSLTGTLTADAVAARNKLDQITREVLMEGWAFNTEYNYPMVPDGNSEIVLPSTILEVDADGHDLDVVERTDTSDSNKLKLYSRYKRTFAAFTSTIKVNLKWLYQFDEVPEHAKNYIMIRASRQFQDEFLGDQVKHSFDEKDEARARAVLQEHEGTTADHSIFNSHSMYNIIDRRI